MVLFLGSSVSLSVLCKHLKGTLLYTALSQEDFCLILCFAVLDADSGSFTTKADLIKMSHTSR